MPNFITARMAAAVPMLILAALALSAAADWMGP